MEDKNERIRMLSEAGFDIEKIKLALNATEEEIAQALDAPVNEPSSQIVAEEDKSPTGMQVKYTEELWNEGKDMRERGFMHAEIAKKQGFSMNFISKMLHCNTYEEVIELRKKQAEKKREYNHRLQASRQYNAKQNWRNAGKESDSKPAEQVSEPKRTNASGDRMYIELCSIADSLVRIAEALEKKRGLFRR